MSRVKASGTLQQAGVYRKHVTGIGFTSGWAAQQQRQFAVGFGMGTEVIVNHQGIAALLHPVLGDSTTAERCQMLQAGQCTGFGDDNGSVVQRTEFAQDVNGIDHCRAFLTNQHINTVHILIMLIEYRINGQ